MVGERIDKMENNRKIQKVDGWELAFDIIVTFIIINIMFYILFVFYFGFNFGWPLARQNDSFIMLGINAVLSILFGLWMKYESEKGYNLVG